MRLIKIVTLLIVCTGFCNSALAVEFRHKGVTLPKKTAKYGIMGFGYLPSFEVDSLYGLGIPQDEAFTQQVVNYLKTSSPNSLNSPLTMDGQKFALNVGIGFKTNSAFRFEGMLTVAQGRKILIPTSFTANVSFNQGGSQALSQQATFSNVDMLTRYVSMMMNTYIDSDFSIFRTYIGLGLGVNMLSATLRGNQSYGVGLTTDQVSTTSTYDNLGIGGNVAVGTQILVSKSAALDISFRQFFNIASFSSATGDSASGGKVTTASPADHSIQVLSLGIVLYF